jgi:hypothetical protein
MSILESMVSRADVATSLPFASAKVYVQHAMEAYGEEARRRVASEEQTNE